MLKLQRWSAACYCNLTSVRPGEVSQYKRVTGRLNDGESKGRHRRNGEVDRLPRLFRKTLIVTCSLLFSSTKEWILRL